ncbi:MAG: FecR family protein [Verrucomicrobiota bacterium]|nr:FecR family protein [Verrucomicrobiota bacterium]
MQKRPVGRCASGLLATALVLLLVPGNAEAKVRYARVTRAAKDVTLISASGVTRGTINAVVTEGTLVRTGPESQTELQFSDQTLARLGAKTAFIFSRDRGAMDLRSGAMLVRAPASAAGTEVNADAATITVAGTTSLIEHNPGKYLKLVVLDGTVRIYLKAHVGESVLVKEGQLLMFHLSPSLTSLPNPVDVDIKRLMATSKLIRGYPPIGSETSIDGGIANQKKEKTAGALAETNLVIYGRGTVVSLVDPASSPSPTPVPKRTTDHGR